MRLNFDEATVILNKAKEQVKENKGYRLGQAIWNLLPDEIANEHRASDVDFFYWTDDERVLNVFFFSNFYII